MVSITLSVPQDMKQDMDNFQEINWSAVAREAIRKKLLMLDRFREFSKESTLTEEDAILLGRDLNSKAAKKHAK